MENYNVFMNYDNILLKEEVARGTRMLNEYGYSPTGDSGDISVRDPNTGLVYVSGSPVWVFQKSLLDARGWERTITTVDGEKQNEWSDPTVEMPMHLAIYRARDDVSAIVHTHSEWASVFALCGMDVDVSLAGQGETGFIRCSEYGGFGTDEISNNVVKALGQNNAAIIKNHGAVCVGKTLDEAFATVAWMELVAEKVYYHLVLKNNEIY